MIEFKPSPLPTMTPLEPHAIRADFAGKDLAWLLEQVADLAEPGKKTFALIHLDDGVLWGRVEKGKLVVSAYQDWTPQLRTLTIQQCRLFSLKGELFIWRIAEGQWRGRKLLDNPGEAYQTIEESQLLSGNRVVAQLPDSFTAIREASTGLRQVVPRTVQVDDDHRLALVVRHYLREDGDGQANIKCSRLVKLVERDLAKEIHHGK
ncbi:MAG: TIGR03984 family CRISPR-associated protein [Acidobacteria bacterium]|nr:TIGR03984 family CRISPR-associated protein [Acidobacteriota bacterium]